MSYTDLKKQVSDFTHRSNLEEQMDTFLLLSEAMIDQELRCQENQIALNVLFDDKVFPLPPDFLEASIINTSRAAPVKQVGLEQLSNLKGHGEVVAYAIHSGKIEWNVAIDPLSPIEGEIVYYAEVESLLNVPTNAVLDKYPLLYLAAMLFNANNFVQDNEEASKWLQLYSSQLKKINKTNIKGRYVLPQVR